MNATIELQIMAEELKSRSLAQIVIESIGLIATVILAAVGNFFTLVIIYKNPALRSPTNLLIASLAVSDFGLATFVGVPFFIPTVVVSRFPFPDYMCEYEAFVIIVMISASMQTIAWTALNRFCRVVKPTKYKLLFSRKRTSVIIAVVWLISFATPLPYMIQGKPFVFHPAKGICFLPIQLDPFSTSVLFGITGIPTVVTYYCYLRVFLRVRHHNARLSQSSTVTAEEISVTKTLCAIVFVFMFCWTPILVTEAVDYARGRWAMPRMVYVVYSFLGLASSSVNPLIYGVLNRQFRGEYFHLMRWCLPRTNAVEPQVGVNP